MEVGSAVGYVMVVLLIGIWGLTAVGGTVRLLLEEPCSTHTSVSLPSPLSLLCTVAPEWLS